MQSVKKVPALLRRVSAPEFKAEAVGHKQAENFGLPECGRKFDVLSNDAADNLRD